MRTKDTLKNVLIAEAESVYRVTENLFSLIEARDLAWIPPTGSNWMSVSQLLLHCASFGCGKAVRGFVRGEWDDPPDPENEITRADQHIPPVSDLQGVESVEEARALLSADHKLTIQCLSEVDEDRLLSETITAPWGGPPLILFRHLLMMIAHLAQHKGQLFYYLKLMGKDVGSRDLWGWS
jgi:hypothetical protein